MEMWHQAKTPTSSPQLKILVLLITGTLVPESFILPTYAVSWSWIISMSVSKTQPGPSLSITFLNSSDFISTPLKFCTPIAMTWITHAPKIYIQITLLCSQIPPSFLLSLNPVALFFVLTWITSSQDFLFYSYQNFFLLTFLTRYLDAIKTTLPSISTFFPLLFCNFIVAKKCKQIESNTVFLGLYPVPWKLPEIEIFHQI